MELQTKRVYKVGNNFYDIHNPFRLVAARGPLLKSSLDIILQGGLIKPNEDLWDTGVIDCPKCKSDETCYNPESAALKVYRFQIQESVEDGIFKNILPRQLQSKNYMAFSEPICTIEATVVRTLYGKGVISNLRLSEKEIKKYTLNSR